MLMTCRNSRIPNEVFKLNCSKFRKHNCMWADRSSSRYVRCKQLKKSEEIGKEEEGKKDGVKKPVVVCVCLRTCVWSKVRLKRLSWRPLGRENKRTNALTDTQTDRQAGRQKQEKLIHETRCYCYLVCRFFFFFFSCYLFSPFFSSLAPPHFV